MTETEYTKGFRAGLAWERERIIKLLEKQIEVHEYYAAIELIKGETK